MAKDVESVIKPGKASGLTFFKALIYLVLAGLILWGMIYLLDFTKTADQVANWTPLFGQNAGQTMLEKVIAAIIGTKVPITIQGIVIFLSLMMILVFAIQDILELFSTFTSSTCWAIAIGLGLIANVTGVTYNLADVMGVTAAVGGLGIALIVLGSVAAAVTLNLGIGGLAKQWRQNRQLEVDQFKARRGTNRIIEGANTMAGVGKVAEVSGE